MKVVYSSLDINNWFKHRFIIVVDEVLYFREQASEIVEWCNSTTFLDRWHTNAFNTDKVFNDRFSIYFMNDEDAMLFKLVWG